MCIIAIKEKGIQLPDEQVLKTMFKNNPDGAGFMYAKDGRVIIQKGFMSYENLKTELFRVSDITDIPLILHFRIATSGKIDGGTTHPFPIERKRNKLKRLYCETDIGVVHNGVIQIKTNKNMSDTMQYIADKLYTYKHLQSDFYRHSCYMKHIESEIRSKMAFLNGKGEIYKIGEFINDNGIIYSNSSYRTRQYIYDPDVFHSSEMILCPIDGYIVDDQGRLTDAVDQLLLIDYYGQVYQYSYEFDVVIPIKAEAYTYSGLPFQFLESEAIVFDTGY